MSKKFVELLNKEIEELINSEGEDIIEPEEEDKDYLIDDFWDRCLG